MKSNPELSPFTSFNLLSAEISPFLLVNLMLLFVFFILFYLAYLVLKILELWILFSFRQKQNNGKTFTKFQLIVLKILRHIDIGLPLMFYLLFWVPICVFSSLNLKFGSSSSQTLFTASTFFSVVFLLVSLALIGLMAFYIFLLFKNTKRYVSTGIEHYCLNGFYDNLTLQHFPKNLQSVRTSSAQNKFHPRFGPYNLHFLNYINERPNDQSNLEELYKHIIDEKHHKKHKRWVYAPLHSGKSEIGSNNQKRALDLEKGALQSSHQRKHPEKLPGTAGVARVGRVQLSSSRKHQQVRASALELDGQKTRLVSLFLLDLPFCAAGQLRFYGLGNLVPRDSDHQFFFVAFFAFGVLLLLENVQTQTDFCVYGSGAKSLFADSSRVFNDLCRF